MGATARTRGGWAGSGAGRRSRRRQRPRRCEAALRIIHEAAGLAPRLGRGGGEMGSPQPYAAPARRYETACLQACNSLGGAPGVWRRQASGQGCDENWPPSCMRCIWRCSCHVPAPPARKSRRRRQQQHCTQDNSQDNSQDNPQDNSQGHRDLLLDDGALAATKGQLTACLFLALDDLLRAAPKAG